MTTIKRGFAAIDRYQCRCGVWGRSCKRPVGIGADLTGADADRRQPWSNQESDAMKMPLRIEFRHMPSSPALRALIQQQLRRLERRFDDLTRCDVVLDIEQRRTQSAKPLCVSIRATRPNIEADVHSVGAQEYAYESVRRAFDALRRQLGDARGALRRASRTPRRGMAARQRNTILTGTT
ncbi:HPF/RaiA family ribosome-associated protein [Solimonas marina]|uniref:Ribosome-associated translation inhibitor RaiA n=1 Tax=Solimonas marina TaxID=2714601 RepID=A0A970B775_9GAMM|nr:HPF/RaiA family ribosome-associated protein [Solimonas marina]NKF23588.1 ribosome-associated translation inhibitor RaiA [Solimonas marina]